MSVNTGFVKELVGVDRITLNELARELDVDLSCLYRWQQRGIRGRNGDRVRLKVFKLAGRTYVRREEFEAFLEAINREVPAPAVELPSKRTKASDQRLDRARAELEGKNVRAQ